MKRDLRDVLRQIAELERAMSERTARRRALWDAEITEMVALARASGKQTARIRKARHDQQAPLRQLDNEMARVRERLGVYEREAQRRER